MKKIILPVLIAITALISKADDSNWKLHPIFDEEVTHVVETPDYVYFTSRNLLYDPKRAEPFKSLFRYDKKGEELMPLSTSNLLNSTSVRDVVYNPAKGYLAVIYKDFSFDLLYNNGNVVHIPYYAQSDLTYSKDVNSMAVDADKDRLYMATDFGYIAINDKKYEIAESRIYGEPLKSFIRMGDKYLALYDDQLLEAPIDAPRLSLDSYKNIRTFTAPEALYPVNDNLCLLLAGGGNSQSVVKITRKGTEYEVEEIYKGNVHNVENTTKGLSIAGGDAVLFVDKDGKVENAVLPENYRNMAVATTDLSNFWMGQMRKGLTHLKKNGEQWSVTKDWMLPSAPATYVTTTYVNHPKHGLLMLNYGYFRSTISLTNANPLQLSGYKQGRWSNYAPAYTTPAKTNLFQSPSGIVVDPDKNNYVYVSHYRDGILRLNLEDPNDMLHMARKGHSGQNNAEYVELPPQQVAVPGYWKISAPHFDSKGNLWMNFANWDDPNPRPHFYCWLAEDRRATTSAQNARVPKEVVFDVYFPTSNTSISLPLLKTGNGLIVYAADQYEESIALLDTNGTPTDTSDDKVYLFPGFIDSDGNPVDVKNTRYLWEDPYTGYVWVCHLNGVFYFVPSQVRQGNYQVYRIKVPRNDGTNLADYLLEGVAVNHMAVDGDGRKWFATSGAGVVATSSDGREILEEFTTANSPLPNDLVYGIGYNSDNNSMMFSTDQGYAEYSLPVSSSSSTKEDIRAYPNPVRPTYSGYVTITDIPQGSFVKITDSAGNLVKELGIMSGFEILWDISDSNFNRVKSGVYHIMVSPSDETSKYSTVGKILVVS